MFTEKYIKKCERLKPLQEEWEPKVGDWVFRKYSLFGEKLDKKIWPKKEQREDLIVLTFQSSAPGYFHASDTKGNVRTFKNEKDIYTETCVFVPTMGDSINMIRGSLRENVLGDGVLEMYQLLRDWFDHHFNMNMRVESLRKIDFNDIWLEILAFKKWRKVWNNKTKRWKKTSEDFSSVGGG